jgi:hypothetical protein
MAVCGFEVRKVVQPNVDQEVDQHIGDDRALICERNFGRHHDAPLQILPLPPERRKSVPRSGPANREKPTIIQDNLFYG